MVEILITMFGMTFTKQNKTKKGSNSSKNEVHPSLILVYPILFVAFFAAGLDIRIKLEEIASERGEKENRERKPGNMPSHMIHCEAICKGFARKWVVKR